MDILTSFVRILLSYRVRAIARYSTKAEAIQRKTLAYLVKTSANTVWGKEYDYQSIRSYEDFATKVPRLSTSRKYMDQLLSLNETTL